MAHYLDPKNDLVFKRVFGEHPHLCMSLLNSLLPLDSPIVSLQYQPAELVPDLPILKNSIVDVRCIDQNGRQFIVEMQMFWTKSFTSRVLLNASKAYIKQLDKSKNFDLLQPVYALCFVNKIFEPDMPEEYFHHYKIVNISHTEKQIKGLELVFIELPKFKPEGIGERKLKDLWMEFLTVIETDSREVPENLLANDDTREALRYVEESAYTLGELNAYDKYLDAIMTERMLFTESREEGEMKGRAEGLAEGKAEGKAEGRAEGLAEGLAEGEIKGKAEVVLNASRNGLSTELIQSITGLSSAQIQEILQQHRLI